MDALSPWRPTRPGPSAPSRAPGGGSTCWSVPAGTGKTTTLAGLKTVWEAAHGRGTVLGLAPSSTAAAELAEALGVTCENTAKWLYESTGPGAVQRGAYLQRLAAERQSARGAASMVRLRTIDTAITCLLY